MILAALMYIAVSIFLAIKIIELEWRVKELEDKKVENEILNWIYEYDDEEEWIDIDNFDIKFKNEK